MDEFGYLSVLLSIIIGLSVTQILIGIRGCLLTRAHIRPFWPVHLWAAFFLLASSQSWWAMFGLRHRHDWDFGDFVIVLAQAVALYLVTGLIYPDFGHEQQIDLRAHYFRQRRHFFSLCIIMLALSISRDLVLDHLAAGIGTANRADPMWQPRTVAAGAAVEPRRACPMRCSALVAPRA